MTGPKDTAAQRVLIAELVAIRKARGLTARMVGRRLHVSPTSVSLFENSVRNGRSPTLRRIVRYAEAIGAEIHVTDGRSQ